MMRAHTLGWSCVCLNGRCDPQPAQEKCAEFQGPERGLIKACQMHNSTAVARQKTEKELAMHEDIHLTKQVNVREEVRQNQIGQIICHDGSQRVMTGKCKLGK